MHLINHKNLLELRFFIKARFNKNIKVKTFALLIISYNIYIIKKTFNKKIKYNIANLILKNIIIIKSFYINIIFKAYLLESGV